MKNIELPKLVFKYALKSKLLFSVKTSQMIVLLLGLLLHGITNAQADLCANAGVVTCGTSLTGQTNVGATNDAFPACNTNGTLATGAPNVWYTFVGTGQSVTVSLCANTSFDSEVGIFSGSCGALVCVAGNDNDFCGTSDESVTFTSVAGTNYFIMVQGHASATGTFTLDVTCAAPPADPCTPIETIACESPKTVTLSGAGAGWSPNSCGFSTPGAEKVYSFTPTVTGMHTLQVTATNSSFIDYFYKAASGGCSSTGWNCIDDVSTASSVTFGPLTAGTTYLILLDDENTSTSTATFQINCPAPPVDPCASPLESITCESPKTATLSGAGGGWSPNNCGFSTPGAEKVYSFTPTVTGIHTLQVTVTDATYIDYFYKDASGSCSSTGWTCLDDISSPTSTTFGPLTAGTTYLILLDDETTTATTHTFRINCPVSCPTLTTVPPNVTIVNSICGGNCTRSGGSITAPLSPCPAGSTLQYNVNNTGWTTSLPAYAQDGPVQSIITRCNCNNDNNVNSPNSSPVITDPGQCTGNCGLTHNSGSVGGCSSTANISATVVTLTSENCYYTSSYTNDQLAFAQKTICGNGSITAQVTSITGGLGWAGVTMRESNAAGAKKAQLMTNLSSFSRREFRITTNGQAYPQQFPSQNRYWLRITRTGNQFSMFISQNGSSWSLNGVQNITMGDCIEVGLVVTNYTANSTVTANFANVSVTGGGIMRPAINTQEDILAIADFSILPNPTNGLVEIDLSSYHQRNVEMELYNLQGKLLRSINIESTTGKEEVDLTTFASGMYLIRVRAEGVPDVTKRVVLNSNY
ncbi:MAG: T9SS type A sorting domain-containing protein [Saprospiraceae bacterium]|nr:T9SS type A sorting domain-containing protein [Saprospiraceae bacterium]